MLTHISSQIRGILVRAVCVMRVPMYRRIFVRILGYERKNDVGNLRKIGLNLLPNIVYALLEPFCTA